MGRILGIDHGEARIGLAISDELGMLAHPLETVNAKAEPLKRIAALATEKGVTEIVIGVPRNMDGSYGPAAEKAQAFAAKVRESTSLPVKLWDERLTTVAAQRSLHEAGKNVKQSRKVIDQVAAQILLQAYLDSKAGFGPAL